MGSGQRLPPQRQHQAGLTEIFASDKVVAPPWPQRSATLGVFLANGVGIGCLGGGDSPGQGGPRAFRRGAERRASGLCGGRDRGDAAHGRFRSSLAQRTGVDHRRFRLRSLSVALGFAWSLETLSVATFLAGMTNGAVDVAMNANASDVERRWGKPIMSSFHAAFSLGGAAGALLGGRLGGTGTVWGLLGPALLSSLLVAARRSLPRSARVMVSGGAAFATPSRRLLPLAALAFVLMATEGAVGDWSGTYLARSGVEAGAAAAGYAAFSVLMIVGPDRRRPRRRRRGPARHGRPRAPFSRPRDSGSAPLAGARRRRRRLRTGRRGPRQHRARAVQRRRADRLVRGGRHRLDGDLRLCRPADRPGRRRRRRFGRRAAARDRRCWRRRLLACGRVRFVGRGRAAICGPPR